MEGIDITTAMEQPPKPAIKMPPATGPGSQSFHTPNLGNMLPTGANRAMNATFTVYNYSAVFGYSRCIRGEPFPANAQFHTLWKRALKEKWFEKWLKSNDEGAAFALFCCGVEAGFNEAEEFALNRPIDEDVVVEMLGDDVKVGGVKWKDEGLVEIKEFLKDDTILEEVKERPFPMRKRHRVRKTRNLDEDVLLERRGRKHQ